MRADHHVMSSTTQNKEHNSLLSTGICRAQFPLSALYVVFFGMVREIGS
jgi:hypothetical protein